MRISDWSSDVCSSDLAAVGHGHADRGAIELALQFGQDERDRARGAGRGRDHRYRRGTRAAQILVDLIEDLLIVGVGVDRKHQPALDPERVVEPLGYQIGRPSVTDGMGWYIGISVVAVDLK